MSFERGEFPHLNEWSHDRIMFEQKCMTSGHLSHFESTLKLHHDWPVMGLAVVPRRLHIHVSALIRKDNEWLSGIVTPEENL